MRRRADFSRGSIRLSLQLEKLAQGQVERNGQHGAVDAPDGKPAAVIVGGDLNRSREQERDQEKSD